MTHERDLERELQHDPQPRRADDAAPGRASASAALSGPAVPVPSGILMRKASGEAPRASGSDAVAAASSSAGSEMPGDLRDRFEGSLGTDLSSVRIHTGAASETAAESVAAKAYTIGNDIHFGAGQYDPHSGAGQQLIAHEVAHTVQQRGGTPARQNKLAISQPGDSLEGEADRAAEAMVSGAPASVTSNGPMISRMPKPGADQPAPKYDSASASVADQQIDIKMFGRPGTIKCTKDGVSGGLSLTKLPPKETSLFKMAEKWPVQLGPAGGVMVGVEGEIKTVAAASVTVSGAPKDYGGPREETWGYAGTVKAQGSLALVASGQVKVVGYFGAGFANINAGGYVNLSASASATLSGSGTWEVGPDGTPQGNASAEFMQALTVKGTGGITIGWEALIASGTFYEVELASHEFLTAKLGKRSTYDFATGTGETTEISEPPQWKPIRFTDPKVTELHRRVEQGTQSALGKVKADQLRQGNDIDGKQSVSPDGPPVNEDTGCDAQTATCDPGEGPA